MQENKGYFKKGFYNHSQTVGFPLLKQFILLEKSGKRCLLLRFVNETELKIDQMQIEITQFDASGKAINKSKVKYKDMRFDPETTYVASRGIVVKDECVDFKVEILYVLSGKYKYVKRNGRATPIYDTRGYDGAPAMGKRNHGVKTKSANVGVGFYRFLAILSLILVVLSCCFVFFVNTEHGIIQAENTSENYTLEA